MTKDERVSIEELRAEIIYNPEEGSFVRRRTGLPVGAKGKTGYCRMYIKGIQYKSHRVAWMIFYGEIPDKIDHINGDRSDNRISNLRSVTSSENSKNQVLRASNTSGCSGVNWHVKCRKWIAQIRDNKKYVYLGSFSELEDAILARKAAEVLYGYHENHGKERTRYERD